MVVNTETGVAQIFWQIAKALLSIVPEQILAIGQFSCLAINDFMDSDGLLEVQAKMEELDLESGIVVAPERPVGPEGDGLIVIPGNGFQ